MPDEGCSGGAVLLLGRGAADHQTGPRAEVDPVVLGELVPLPGRQRRGRQRAARRPDVGAVGRLQVLDPPALAGGGAPRLAPAHPDVSRAVDAGVGAPAAPRPTAPAAAAAQPP